MRTLFLAVLTACSGCLCGQQAFTQAPSTVCALSDAGRPESGEPFVVQASPGFDHDAGCTTALGDRTNFVPFVICTVPALPPGRYAVSQQGGPFTFFVPSTDAGFPRCP